MRPFSMVLAAAAGADQRQTGLLAAQFFQFLRGAGRQPGSRARQEGGAPGGIAQLLDKAAQAQIDGFSFVFHSYTVSSIVQL